MKSLRDQIAGKCVHFNGISKKTCDAGMSYDEVDKDNRVAYRAGLPCFKPDLDGIEGHPKCACPHLRFPSEEEVQKELDEHERSVKKFTVALLAVNPIREKYKGKNWSGIIECPVCKGKLHVSHAACNGHVHARCETEGCVAWME